MTVSIRSAVLSDLPAILEIERQAPAAAHWSSDQYRRQIDGGVVLVAEREGRVAGFLCAKTVMDEWEIENVVVAPQWLRQGISSELLRELTDRAKSAGASSVLLEVRESNLPARRLYEKHGFQQVGQRRVYYQHPAEDAILYALHW